MASDSRNQRNDIFKSLLTLFLIAAISVLFLFFLRFFTLPAVQKNAAEQLDESLHNVLPGATEFSEVKSFDSSVTIDGYKVAVKAVYLAKNASGEKIGYCVEVNPSGYNEPIDMMVGIDSNGAVCGVDIISIDETPGIGMKIQNDENFRQQVYGLNQKAKLVQNEPSSKEEVQAIAGATESSAAYVNGINAAIEVVQNLN